MKDRRFVDDLNLEELERALLIKRREARLTRLRQIDRLDQAMGRDLLEPAPPSPGHAPIPTAHRQFQGTGASATYHSVEIDDESRQPFTLQLKRWLSMPLHINWRFVSNRILLLIEITAVAGLILIVLSTWQSREVISEDTEQIVVPPTPTATPVTNAVVLPGGHTPPDARGFSQPEPIPGHLQALAQAIKPHPVPTRGPEHSMRIVIPSIEVDHPVVEGDDWEALKRGVGHTSWSANPGEVGNCVLSAHNDIFGAIFRQLPEVELGDEIFVHTSDLAFHYVVKASHIVEPTQVEFMDPTDHSVLTLISSYPFLIDNKRIVVIAELEPQ